MTVFFKNADITIYNKYYDANSDTDRYQRTIIKGVNWQSKRNATVNDKGINVAYTTLIFLDSLPNYVDSRTFAKLDDIDRPNYFTFTELDKIVKGAIDYEVTGVKPNTIANLENEYETVTVMASQVWDNHMEVECK